MKKEYRISICKYNAAHPYGLWLVKAKNKREAIKWANNYAQKKLKLEKNTYYTIVNLAW